MTVFRHIPCKALALTLLLLFGGVLRPLAAQPLPVPQPASVLVGQTHEETPAWQDLGLKDLLTPATESEAPSAQASHTAGSTAAAQPYTNNGRRPLLDRRHLPARAGDYYLFFLYRLRL